MKYCHLPTILFNMAITETKIILLNVVILPLIIIWFILISALEAEMKINRVSTDLAIHRTKSLSMRESSSEIGIKRVERVSKPHGNLGRFHEKGQHIRNVHVEDSKQIEVEQIKVKNTESSSLNANNRYEFNPCVTFGNRSIEGKFEFGYTADRTLYGKALITYKNIQTLRRKYFGFEIIIKYLRGEKITLRVNIMCGNDWKARKAGMDLLDYIPAICFKNVPNMPLFKLCIKMTQVTFSGKKRIQFCFSLHLQMVYFIKQNLYTRCMNFTTSTFQSLMARLPTLRKLPVTEKKNCRAIKTRYIPVGGGELTVEKSDKKEFDIPIID